jgi:hypothetical protein
MPRLAWEPLLLVAVERLIEATKDSRNEVRATIHSLCQYRSGLPRAPHFLCKSNCTRFSSSTRRTIRVAMAAASPKFKTEKPTW